MASGCKAQTDLGSLETQMFQSMLLEDINYALDNIIGSYAQAKLVFGDKGKLGERALEEYKATREYITETINLYAQVVGYKNINQEHINGLLYMLSDMVQEYTGSLGVKESLILKGNPREAISAFKLMRNAVRMQRKKVLKGGKGNKIINAFERAFFLPHFLAARVSIGGDIYRYIKRLQFFAEDVRKASHDYRKRYAKIKKGYYDNLFNKLMSMDHIPPEYVMDGVEIGSGVYKGTVKKRGISFHLVEDELGNLKEIPDSEISKSEIVEAVINKYLAELADDVLSGQTRYIEWGRVDKKWAEYIFRKMEDKRKLDPEDFKKGIPEIHQIKTDHGTYYYTIRKRGKKGSHGIFIPELDKFGREVYDGYFLWVKTNDGKVKRLRDADQKAAMKATGVTNGFYRAKQDKIYGKKYDPKKRKLHDDGSIERGFDFSNITELKINPHPELLTMSLSKDTIGFWEHIQHMRQLYRDVGLDMMRKWELLNKKYKSAFSKLARVVKEHPDKHVIDQLEGIMKLGMRFHVDKNGNIVSPNSGFQLLSDNYSPVMFSQYELITMIESRLDEMRRRHQVAISNGEDGEQIAEDIARLERFLDSLITGTIQDEMPDNIATLLKAVKAPIRLNDNEVEVYSRLIVGANIAFWEHRSTWTDRTRRRKDPGVFFDYIDKAYYAIKKQEVLLDLIDIAYDRVSSGTAGKNGEVIDWLVNRTRIQFRDPYHEAKIGPIDISYQKLADTLNKFKVFGEHDAESIRRFIESTRAMFASILLGASVGLVNRTQIVNSIVRYGSKLYREANAIVEGTDKRLTQEQLDAIMDYLGVDEVVNIFTEWVSRGNDIGLRDAMAIPFVVTPIQIPGAGSISLASAKAREKFISTLPTINKAKKLADYNRVRNRAKRLAMKRAEIFSSLDGLDKKKVEAYLRLYDKYRKRLQSPDERETIEDAIEAIYDYILSGKADKNGLPYQKLKKALPGVTETILRRAVSWKVSWMPAAGFKGAFTMTESERILRRTDAMMALLFAAEAGYLGKYGKDFSKLQQKTIEYVDKETGEKRAVKVPSIFVSESAVRIARNSVYSTMFGLSVYHQGEAFAGLGQQIFMYKTYPLNQTVHDFKILKQFFSGSNAIEAIPRILRAMGDIATGKTKNPSNSKVDWPAVRVVRFLLSRMAMTGLLVAMEMIPMLRRMLFTLNSPTTSMLRSLIMGGESPLIRIGIRMLLNAIVFSSFDTDDQDERRLIYDIWDIVRLFFPVFITYPANVLWSIYHKWLE